MRFPRHLGHFCSKAILIVGFLSQSILADSTGSCSEDSAKCAVNLNSQAVRQQQTIQLASTSDVLSALPCDEQTGSNAILNSCGYCVLGNTGRAVDYGLDSCGVCNGEHACLGCDGVMSSQKRFDSCGVCLDRRDDNFGKGCVTALPKSVYDPIVVPSSGGNVNLSADGRGISANTVNCAISGTGQAENNASVKSFGSTNQLSASGIQLTMPPLGAGSFNMNCSGNNSAALGGQFSNRSMLVVEPESIRAVSVTPQQFQIGDANVVLSLTGNFVLSLLNDTYCLAVPTFSKAASNGKSNAATSPPSESLKLLADQPVTQKLAKCPLDSKLFKSTTYNLWLVPSPSLESFAKQFVQPLSLTVQGQKPTIMSALFGDDLISLLITFDTNVNAESPQSCANLFMAHSLAKLGSNTACELHANVLSVQLGKDATILANSDQLQFKPDTIYQLGAEFPVFLSATNAFTLQIPKNSARPSIDLDVPTELAVACSTTANSSEVQPLTVLSETGGGQRPLQYNITMGYSVILQGIQNKERRLLTLGQAKPIDSTSATTKKQIALPIDALQLAAAGGSPAIELNITVCNFVQICSAYLYSIRINLNASSATRLSADIDGLPSYVTVGLRLLLVPQVWLENCKGIDVAGTNTLSEFKFTWTVTPVGSVTPFVKSDARQFKLQTDSFAPGSAIQISLSAEATTAAGKVVKATYSEFVTFKLQVLTILLDCSSKVIGRDEAFSIDASRTAQTAVGIKLSYQWTCVEADNETRPSPACSGISQTPVANVATFRVPGSILAPGRYAFTVTVSNAISATVSITILAASSSVPTIQPLALASIKPDPNSPITIAANVKGSESKVTVWLKFADTPGYGNVSIPAAIAEACTQRDVKVGNGSFRYSCTLPRKDSVVSADWKGLAGDTSYRAQILASNDAGTAQADVVFRTNKPPSIGTIKVAPKSGGTALLTEFLLEADQAWIDEPTDYPLTYIFGVKVANANEDSILWQPPQFGSSLTTILATASAAAKCNRTGYQAVLKVCDTFGSCSQATSETFEVLPPASINQAVSNISSKAQFSLEKGDVATAAILMTQILAEFCWTSPTNASANASMIVARTLLQSAMDNEASDTVESMSNLRQAVLLLQDAAAVSDNSTISALKSVADTCAQQIVKQMSILPANTHAGDKLRRKRQVLRQANSSAAVKPVDAQSASTLLGAYETIVRSGLQSDSVTVFLQTVHNLLSGFCVSLDASSEPLTAQSQTKKLSLAMLKAQVTDMRPTSLNSSFSLPCDNCGPSVTLAPKLTYGYDLKSLFNAWACARGQAVCSSVCLASALLPSGTEISAWLLGNESASAASHVYLIKQIDQMNGDAIEVMLSSASLNANGSTSTANFVIEIPLQISDAAAYDCKLLKTDGTWQTGACSSGSIKQVQSSKMLTCYCSVSGYIAAFRSANSPSPRETLSARQMHFRLLGDYASVVALRKDSLISSLKSQLSNISGAAIERFMYFNLTNGSIVVDFVIQPPRTALPTEVSAADAADRIKQRLISGSPTLYDLNNRVMPLDETQSVKIVPIAAEPVAAALDNLPIIVGSVVGGAFLIIVVAVVTLVIIKQKGRREKRGSADSPFEDSPNHSAQNSANTNSTILLVRRTSFTEQDNRRINGPGGGANWFTKRSQNNSEPAPVVVSSNADPTA